MRKLLAASHRTMPWKNGGGTTTEIARFPPGSTLDDFEWRVSMARVEAAGPFSRFRGIDRSLALVEGEGVALVIDGGQPVRIDEQSPPFSFSGDASTSATLTGGAIEDLNVMTRRGRFRHTARRQLVDRSTSIPMHADVTVLVIVRGVARALRDGLVEHLGARDALILERGPELLLSVDEDVEMGLLAAELWRC